MTLRERIDTGLESWGRRMYRRHWIVLALALAQTAAMVSLLPQLRTENSSQSYLHGDDPEAVRYDAFTAQFGQDELILLAITSDDLFAPEFLAKLRDLHDEILAEVPHVADVNSLINARHTRGEVDALIVEDLLAQWPETPAEFAALRELVFANPLYLDTLVSRDGRTTTLTVEPALYSDGGDGGDALAGFEESGAALGTEPVALSGDERADLVAAVDAIVERFDGPGFPIQVVGGPITAARVTEMLNADVRAYMAVAGGIIAALLFLLFRRISGVFLPALVVASALLTTLGTMVLLDVPFSLVLGMLPIFTLTVGVCTAVHILVVVYQQVGKGVDPEDAVATAFRHSGLAICMASFTTAAGMLSFLAAEVAPLRDLGVIAPFAVLYAFAFSMTVLPAALAVTPLRAHVRGEKRARVGLSERLLVALGSLAVRRARWVIAFAGGVTLLAAVGATQLRFAHEPVAWFPAGDPTRLAIETVDRVLRGSSSVEVVIDTGRENGLHEPATLRRVEAAMAFAEGLEVNGITIGKAMSLVDIVKEGHQALNANSPAYRAIPEERPVIAQELLLFENGGGDDLWKFSDSRFQIARLSLRIPESDAIQYQAFLEALSAGLTGVLGEELPFTVTGRTTLMARVMAALITSMGRSYVFALLVITPLMIALIGDLRLGLISMLPNLFPVIFVLGTMGWLGIPLDASNIVVGSIVIGLAVDDTIHFLQRFRVEYLATHDVADAVRGTMRGTGAAMFFTSLVLATGFSVMAALGSMSNTVHFGALCALGIVVALLADLVFTPALIELSGGRSFDLRAARVVGGTPAAAAGHTSHSTQNINTI